jgi:radical SAM superfamily enzyme YgiQ (UPF0313 family)
MKILLVYPNLPLMMSPSIAMGLFNAIAIREGVDIDIFETTSYSDEYQNRHLRLAEIGAVRQNKKSETQDMFYIQPTDKIIPDYHNKIKTFQPDVIVMSLVEDVWGIAKTLLDQSARYDIPTVLGGIFPTSAPEMVLAHPHVNMVAMHEGERTFTDIIKYFRAGKSLTDIKSIWWKDHEGAIHKNPFQDLCDITDVLPDYSLFAENRYQRPMGGKIWQKAMSMETYRGCPYNCTYCGSPFLRDFTKINEIGNFLRRKPAHIIDQEFTQLKEKHNPDFIMFQDDSFLARPEREIFEFCEVWSKHCTPFWFNTRVENCKPNTLQALKDVGLYRMAFGIESGNEEYRQNVLDRRVKNETYYEHFDIINDSNIPYSLNIIIGMPCETRAHVFDSIRMVKRSAGYDGLMVNYFQPYLGTGLRDLAVRRGFLDPNHINGNTNESMGGYMDGWVLKQPLPYLQHDEVMNLVKTFPLYAYFPETRWGEVFNAETDDNVLQSLLAEYKDNFLTDQQMGGADRLCKKFCAQHDATSTYYWEFAN